MVKKIPSEKLQIGAGYIRESTEEQDKGFSPDNQRRMIEDYAAKHGIKIVEWYKDLVTGTKAAKRDDFQRMIADASLKKFEVILVFHTSRFARNVEEARQYKTLLRNKLGINVVSVTQNFGSDWTDPSAFLNEGINELFDEHYSKQLSFWVRNALMEKRRQGKQTGNPPFGYYKRKIGFDKDNNRPIYEKEWRVEPKEAKLVKKIYEMYSTGRHSYRSIAIALNKLGARMRSQPFTYSTVKDILSNEVYLGKVFSRKKKLPTLPGVHPAIISQGLFDKVRAMIGSRRNTIGRPVAQHRFYLLQDLVYCWYSRSYLAGKEDMPDNTRLIPKMYSETHQWVDAKGVRHEKLMYHCKIRREKGDCKQLIVPAEIIDKQVIDLMEGFRLPNDIIEMSLGYLKDLFKQAERSVKDLDTVSKLESKKKKLNFQYANTDAYTEAEYLAMLAEMDDELAKYESLGLVRNNSKAKEKDYLRKTEKFLTNFKKFWRTDIGFEERREWIRMTIKRVWVKDKKVVGIEPHDDFKPLFVSHRKVLVQPPSGTPGKKTI